MLSEKRVQAGPKDKTTPLRSHLTPRGIGRILEREGALHVVEVSRHILRRSVHFRVTAIDDRVLARALHHKDEAGERSLTKPTDRTPLTLTPVPSWATRKPNEETVEPMPSTSRSEIAHVQS